MKDNEYLFSPSFASQHLTTERHWRLDRIKLFKNGLNLKIEWSPGKDRDPWLWTASRTGESKPVRHGRAPTLDIAMRCAEGRK